mmetsp:Transcript_14674/g.55276  ORF Transcript_14674/g.55276 Transcript_14674/m.55276 type:complete len:625 (-) Transcript_14674:109-1983(-)
MQRGAVVRVGDADTVPRGARPLEPHARSVHLGQAADLIERRADDLQACLHADRERGHAGAAGQARCGGEADRGGESGHLGEEEGADGVARVGGVAEGEAVAQGVGAGQCVDEVLDGLNLLHAGLHGSRGRGGRRRSCCCWAAGRGGGAGGCRRHGRGCGVVGGRRQHHEGAKEEASGPVADGAGSLAGETSAARGALVLGRRRVPRVGPRAKKGDERHDRPAAPAAAEHRAERRAAPLWQGPGGGLRERDRGSVGHTFVLVVRGACHGGAGHTVISGGVRNGAGLRLGGRRRLLDTLGRKLGRHLARLGGIDADHGASNVIARALGAAKRVRGLELDKQLPRADARAGRGKQACARLVEAVAGHGCARDDEHDHDLVVAGANRPHERSLSDAVGEIDLRTGAQQRSSRVQPLEAGLAHNVPARGCDAACGHHERGHQAVSERVDARASPGLALAQHPDDGIATSKEGSIVEHGPVHSISGGEVGFGSQELDKGAVGTCAPCGVHQGGGPGRVLGIDADATAQQGLHRLRVRPQRGVMQQAVARAIAPVSDCLLGHVGGVLEARRPHHLGIRATREQIKRELPRGDAPGHARGHRPLVRRLRVQRHCHPLERVVEVAAKEVGLLG